MESMLNVDDIPWNALTGGYGSPYDPRRALLEAGNRLSGSHIVDSPDAQCAERTTA